MAAWISQTGLCNSANPHLHGIHASALFLIAALALHLSKPLSESLWLGHHLGFRENKSDVRHPAACCLTQQLAMLTSACMLAARLR